MTMNSLKLCLVLLLAACTDQWPRRFQAPSKHIHYRDSHRRKPKHGRGRTVWYSNNERVKIDAYRMFTGQELHFSAANAHPGWWHNNPDFEAVKQAGPEYK